MIVCLDSGNSRIKWGVHDGAQWLAQGAVAHADVEQLARLLQYSWFSDLPLKPPKAQR